MVNFYSFLVLFVGFPSFDEESALEVEEEVPLTSALGGVEGSSSADGVGGRRLSVRSDSGAGGHSSG